MIGAPDMAKLPKLVQLVAIATPLGSYLAGLGLMPGDGHIWVSKSTEKKTSSKITFHQKNMPLAEKLLGLIGYGFIRSQAKQNACVLTIYPTQGRSGSH